MTEKGDVNGGPGRSKGRLCTPPLSQTLSGTQLSLCPSALANAKGKVGALRTPHGSPFHPNPIGGTVNSRGGIKGI